MNAHEWTAVLALSFIAGCSSADDSAAATGNGNNDEHGTPDAATMDQKSGPDSGFDTAKDAHAEMSTPLDATADMRTGGDATAPDTAADAGAAEDASDAGGDANDGPGIFVAVGYGGRRIRSIDDGRTWIDDQSLAAHGGDDNDLLRTVVYGAGHFVALGWRAMDSQDAHMWTDHGANIGQWIGASVFAKGTFVAVGGYGLHAVSADGITWDRHDTGTVAAHTHDGLAFGDVAGGRFVMANDDGHRSYSGDGKTWTDASGAAATKSTEIAFGNGLFVGLADTAVVASSDGGATFSDAATLGMACQGLVFAQGHFTALAQGHVFTSANGSQWTDHTVAGISGGAIAYGHGTYVTLQASKRRRSTDGITWEPPVSDDSGDANSLETITFGASAD